MLICIDFDGTYTADPELWDLFLEAAKMKGHTVVCATMRYENELQPVRNMLEGKVSEIIPTSRKAKHAFVRNHLGKRPDIWIDDQPHWLFEDSL